MLRKLIQIGNSYGIIIQKSILDLLKINPVRDEIEFIVREEEIIIRKGK